MNSAFPQLYHGHSALYSHQGYAYVQMMYLRSAWRLRNLKKLHKGILLDELTSSTFYVIINDSLLQIIGHTVLNFDELKLVGL